MFIVKRILLLFKSDCFVKEMEGTLENGHCERQSFVKKMTIHQFFFLYKNLTFPFKFLREKLAQQK
jgi:hypothetical protein